MVSALSVAQSVNPFESDLPVGSIIPAVEAVDWLAAITLYTLDELNSNNRPGRFPFYWVS